jgi:hypothetical protein
MLILMAAQCWDAMDSFSMLIETSGFTTYVHLCMCICIDAMFSLAAWPTVVSLSWPPILRIPPLLPYQLIWEASLWSFFRFSCPMSCTNSMVSESPDSVSFISLDPRCMDEGVQNCEKVWMVAYRFWHRENKFYE